MGLFDRLRKRQDPTAPARQVAQEPAVELSPGELAEHESALRGSARVTFATTRMPMVQHDDLATDAAAEGLLDRHGVVTRGAVVAEEVEELVHLPGMDAARGDRHDLLDVGPVLLEVEAALQVHRIVHLAADVVITPDSGSPSSLPTAVPAWMWSTPASRIHFVGNVMIDNLFHQIGRLRAEGLRVSGPHSADTLFHAAARAPAAASARS